MQNSYTDQRGTRQNLSDTESKGMTQIHFEGLGIVFAVLIYSYSEIWRVLLLGYNVVPKR